MAQTQYEMMYILRPDLSEEQIAQETTKYSEMLAANGAAELEVQVRGKRRLAYPIRKHLDGVYVQVNYQADGDQVAPVERAMRLSDDVLRYLTMKLDHRQTTAVSEEAAEPVEA